MKRHSRGFTLIEVAVIIAVLAIIATVVLVAFTQVQADARDAARKNGGIALATALRKYHDDKGEYPNVCPGGVNVECSASTYLASSLVPNYLSAIPTQPANAGGDTTYRYIRGTSPDSFGILIETEVNWGCIIGDDPDTSSWWLGWFSNCNY